MANDIDFDNFENNPDHTSPMHKERFANETETDNGVIYNQPENGTFEVYWGNGQLRYQWDYKDGRRADGESKGWWPDGSWKQIKTFKDGELNGRFVEWYGDGQKKSEGSYKDGKQDGLETWWYENGEKWKEGTYNEGLLWDTDSDKPYTGEWAGYNYENGERLSIDILYKLQDTNNF